MTEDGAARAAADATIARFRDAGERLDADAILETLAPSVRVTSPISGRARFEGLGEVAELLRAAFDVMDDVEYFEESGTASTRALFFRVRIGDQPAEAAILLRLDEHARVTEMTLFIRPLPGLAAFAAALTPRLAAPRGRVRALALAAMTRPMAVLTSRADALGVRLMQGRR